MIVSFTGAQSTGKSTLLEECRRSDKFKSFSFEPEVTRWVKKEYNLSINEEGNELTQLAILNRHFHNYLSYEGRDVVMDRCILDGIVYTKYMHSKGKVDDYVLMHANYLFKKLIKQIDIIFYTMPDIPLIDDGERSINKEFRDEVISIFEGYLKAAEPTLNVIKLEGSVENRMNVIYNSIDNYGK